MYQNFKNSQHPQYGIVPQLPTEFVPLNEWNLRLSQIIQFWAEFMLDADTDEKGAIALTILGRYLALQAEQPH